MNVAVRFVVCKLNKQNLFTMKTCLAVCVTSTGGDYLDIYLSEFFQEISQSSAAV